MCQVILRSANEVRVLRQINEMIKHYNFICRC